MADSTINVKGNISEFRKAIEEATTLLNNLEERAKGINIGGLGHGVSGSGIPRTEPLPPVFLGSKSNVTPYYPTDSGLKIAEMIPMFLQFTESVLPIIEPYLRRYAQGAANTNGQTPAGGSNGQPTPGQVPPFAPAPGPGPAQQNSTGYVPPNYQAVPPSGSGVPSWASGIAAFLGRVSFSGARSQYPIAQPGKAVPPLSMLMTNPDVEVMSVIERIALSAKSGGMEGVDNVVNLPNLTHVEPRRPTIVRTAEANLLKAITTFSKAYDPIASRGGLSAARGGQAEVEMRRLRLTMAPLIEAVSQYHAVTQTYNTEGLELPQETSIELKKLFDEGTTVEDFIPIIGPVVRGIQLGTKGASQQLNNINLAVARAARNMVVRQRAAQAISVGQEFIDNPVMAPPSMTNITVMQALQRVTEPPSLMRTLAGPFGTLLGLGGITAATIKGLPMLQASTQLAQTYGVGGQAMLEGYSPITGYSERMGAHGSVIRSPIYGAHVNGILTQSSVLKGFATPTDLMNLMGTISEAGGREAKNPKNVMAFALSDANQAAIFARAMGISVQQGGQLWAAGMQAGLYLPGGSKTFATSLAQSAAESGMPINSYLAGYTALIQGTQNQVIPTGVAGMYAGLSKAAQTLNLPALSGPRGAEALLGINQGVVSGGVFGSTTAPVAYQMLAALNGGKMPTNLNTILRLQEQGVTTAPQLANVLGVIKHLGNTPGGSVIQNAILTQLGAGGLYTTEGKNLMHLAGNQKGIADLLSGKPTKEGKALLEQVQAYQQSPGARATGIASATESAAARIADEMSAPLSHIAGTLNKIQSNTLTIATLLAASVGANALLGRLGGGGSGGGVSGGGGGGGGGIVQDILDGLGISAAAKGAAKVAPDLLSKLGIKLGTPAAAEATDTAGTVAADATEAGAMGVSTATGIGALWAGAQVLTGLTAPAVTGFNNARTGNDINPWWDLPGAIGGTVGDIVNYFFGTTGGGGGGGGGGKSAAPAIKMGKKGSGPTYYYAPQFRKAHVPDWLGLGTELFEGDISPSKYITDTNGLASVGPLQENLGGQAKGYSVKQLTTNQMLQATLGVKPIADAYRKGLAYGYSGLGLFEYTLGHSGHPDYNGLSPSAAYRAAQIWEELPGLQAYFNTAVAHQSKDPSHVNHATGHNASTTSGANKTKHTMTTASGAKLSVEITLEENALRRHATASLVMPGYNQ